MWSQVVLYYGILWPISWHDSQQAPSSAVKKTAPAPAPAPAPVVKPQLASRESYLLEHALNWSKCIIIAAKSALEQRMYLEYVVSTIHCDVLTASIIQAQASDGAEVSEIAELSYVYT